LESAKCYDDLIQLVNERVQSYRSFLNWNSNEIPRSILETKTSISIPLSQAVNCLRQSGIIADDVALFVAVDQIEFLKKIDWSKASTGERSLGSDFVKLLMTCLASRDTRVCYKVACRPYAFSKELLNTEAVLEVGRDYQMVNLDEILRAKENTNRKLYQNFVKDICLRRISYRGFSELADEKIFKEFLPGLNDEEEAARYGSGADAFSKSLDSNPLLSKKIKKQLSDHYKINPMQALLGLAWYLQKHAKNQEDLGSGWLNKSSAILKNTWSKERKEHALLLSASFNNQRKIYCGWTDIVSISGYSTMVFLYLMREIWDNWQRSSLVDWEKVEKYSDLRIDVRIQSAAIWTICAIYFDKIQEKPHGDKIKDFVERFALAVKDNMKQDSAMSYPGYTGFSLSMSDLETHREVLEFIKRCVQYGFLHEHDHTSKEEKVSRKKWYLAPILCVRFDIPLYTGKEPYYAKAYEIWKWMNGDFKIRLRKSSNDDQQSFLDL
jgi:hypothetical protein